MNAPIDKLNSVGLLKYCGFLMFNIGIFMLFDPAYNLLASGVLFMLEYAYWLFILSYNSRSLISAGTDDAVKDQTLHG
jgi:hypothetical protein